MSDPYLIEIFRLDPASLATRVRIDDTDIGISAAAMVDSIGLTEQINAIGYAIGRSHAAAQITMGTADERRAVRDLAGLVAAQRTLARLWRKNTGDAS